MFITYKFRIKDSQHINFLKEKANAVNFVWNYCNQISQESARRKERWISEYNLNNLTSGSSKDLKLSSTTINRISSQFIINRNIIKRPKLKWRTKKSLGWVPFNPNGIQIQNDSFTYLGRKFKFWKSREIKGKLKVGSFNEDSRGRWYINFTCEIESPEPPKATESIGIDLGLKTLATLSTGEKIENPKILAKYADKLAKAQRAKHKKQVAKIHTKIKNVRKDFLHKETTKLIKQFKQIFVGDVSSPKLVKTIMAKSILDSGWGLFKSMLAYKAIRLGVEFKVINEKYSTVTCSVCNERSGPSGLSTLGIREWECSKCKTQHLRDHNAAKNILNFALGHQSLLEETLILGGCQ